jgi:hypothetical protein
VVAPASRPRSSRRPESDCVVAAITHPFSLHAHVVRPRDPSTGSASRHAVRRRVLPRHGRRTDSPQDTSRPRRHHVRRAGGDTADRQPRAALPPARAVDPKRIREALTGFPRLGPVEADIFCREAQDVWPELRPAIDGKALDGARRVGLPTDPEELARLAPGSELAPLVAALVRVALEKSLAEEVRAAA